LTNALLQIEKENRKTTPINQLPTNAQEYLKKPDLKKYLQNHIIYSNNFRFTKNEKDAQTTSDIIQTIEKQISIITNQKTIARKKQKLANDLSEAFWEIESEINRLDLLIDKESQKLEYAINNTPTKLLKRAQYHYGYFCTLLQSRSFGFAQDISFSKFVSYIDVFINIATLKFLDKDEFSELRKKYDEKHKDQGQVQLKYKIMALRHHLENDTAFCILKMYKDALKNKIKESKIFVNEKLKIAHQIAKDIINKKKTKDNHNLYGINVTHKVTTYGDDITVYIEHPGSDDLPTIFSKTQLREEEQNESPDKRLQF